jgi:hypothetical protein
VFEFAGAITLQAYSESSVAKPLALTGAYAGKTARKRFLETASFWIAVSEAGALRPDAPGRAAALRVRVMHVFVRRKLLAHPEWNAKAWGVPISQADALLTLMGGSFAPGVALHALGYRTSVRDIEAMMHFWRFVGHLMGVRPHFYPRSMREAAQLTFVAMLKGAETAGEDGKNLCRSYAQAFAPDVRDGLHTPPRERRAAALDAREERLAPRWRVGAAPARTRAVRLRGRDPAPSVSFSRHGRRRRRAPPPHPLACRPHG